MDEKDDATVLKEGVELLEEEAGRITENDYQAEREDSEYVS